MSRYIYKINNIEVFPLNADVIEFTFKKKSEANIVLQKEINTELIFAYQSGSFNFKTQETVNKCTELIFNIYRYCGSAYSLFFEGLFSVAEGSFDDYKCTFRIKVRIKTEVLDDVQVNFLDAPIVKLVKTGGGTRTYTNGRDFESTILTIIQKTNPKIVKIVSNFFQINPLIISADCLPGVTNYWKHLVFFALSDIQEPIPTNLATREVVTFKQIMEDLNSLFDVYYFIDSNYNLRIEHRLFFDGIVGLNLIGNKNLIGKNSYTYDSNQYPKEEVWDIINHDTSAKLIFSGLSNIVKQSNVKNYKTLIINTDYYKIRNTTGGASVAGMFLFATDGSDNMIEVSGQNDKLTPNYLVQNLHTYYRSNLHAIFISIKKQPTFPYNKYTGGGITLKSIRPSKKQVEISIPLCCDQEFDSQNKVITDMGIGQIQEGIFETKTNTLRLSLMYPVDNCINLLPNEIPGLRLWLKFNEGITLSAGNVTQWNDASGNANHAVQATGAQMPLYNALTGEITFDTIRNLKTPAFQILPSKRGTIIALMRVAAVNAAFIISTFDGSASQFFDFTYNGASLWNYADTYFYPTQNTYGAGSTDGLYIMRRISNVELEVFQNGSKPTNFDNPFPVANTQPASLPLVIGYNANNNIYGSYGSMVLNELMIYDSVLTDDQIESIQFYLIKKGIFKIY